VPYDSIRLLAVYRRPDAIELLIAPGGALGCVCEENRLFVDEQRRGSLAVRPECVRISPARWAAFTRAPV